MDEEWAYRTLTAAVCSQVQLREALFLERRLYHCHEMYAVSDILGSRMLVADFKGAWEVSTAVELETALKKRYGHDANSFWLSHPPNRSSLAILMKGDLASVNYLPDDGRAGFRSVGHVEGLEPGEMSIFYLDSETQEQPMLNDSIVPFSDALRAAKEFLECDALPTSIEWFEL